MEAECTFAYVVVDHERIIYHDARLQEEAVFVICILINVWFVTVITRQFTTDCVLAEVELGVVANELQKCFSQVRFNLERGLTLLLQERDDHQEESVRRESSCVSIVEVPDFEHLLEHEDHGFNQLRLSNVALNQVYTGRSIVVLRPKRNVNVDRLRHYLGVAWRVPVRQKELAVRILREMVETAS